MSNDKNKIVIITGIGGGIGRATAEIFKRKNWYVIGVDIKKKTNSFFVDEFYNVDVSKYEELKKFCILISKKHNTLNAIVNNAAIQVPKSIIDLSIGDWNKTFAVNVRPAFLLTKLLHSLLKNSEASIVNVSSVHAVATSKNISAYASSKGALLTLTKAMALEFAKDKIRANVVLPGAVDTPMLKQGLNRGHLEEKNIRDKLQELVQKHPLKRIANPKEIAEMIFFLADNKKSSFITGQSFIIDGGATAKLSTE